MDAEVEVLIVVGLLCLEGEDRGLLAKDEWEVIGPLAGDVYEELESSWPEPRFAGKKAVGVYIREFLSRAYARQLISPERVPQLHAALWGNFDAEAHKSAVRRLAA